MPVWKATVHIHDSELLGDEDYSFNCHVNSDTTLNAWERANEVAEALVGNVLPDTCTIPRVSVANTDVVNGSLSKTTTLVGTRAVSGGAIPGWNVVKIQASVAEGVRPHTWFLRIGLTENDIVGQVLETGVQTAVAAFISAFLLTGANCDKDGFSFVVGAASPDVAMRQMGWRRRHRPGFKRGWVPV
jgi:hypothetical protein